MDFTNKIKYGAENLSIALVAASFSIIFLFRPINNFLMKIAKSYVVYMLIFAALMGIIIYVAQYLINVDTVNNNVIVAIVAFLFCLIILFQPLNIFIMRSSGSYVIYMIVFALLMGLVVYITERLLE